MPLPTVTIFGTINKIELRYSTQGMAICSFQVECSEKNQKDGWENLTLRGSVFEKSAEFINQWFNDGDLCIATGKLFTEVYEKDGVKKYTTKLKFPKIEFPPRAKNNGENNSGGYGNGEDNNQSYQAPEPSYEDHPDKQNRETPYNKPSPVKIPENNLPEIDINEDEIPF